MNMQEAVIRAFQLDLPLLESRFPMVVEVCSESDNVMVWLEQAQ